MNTNEQYKLEVTIHDCGTWLPGYRDIDSKEYIHFSMNVVDLAIENGMYVDSWDMDRAVISAGVAEDMLLNKLDQTLFDAVEYLNSILPSDNFWFEADGWGLTLFFQYPDGSILGV